MDNCCCSGPLNKVAGILVLIGALNWGLTGIGYFLNGNWNVVNLVLGGMPVVEAVVYVLVGVAAVIKVVKCGCK